MLSGRDQWQVGETWQGVDALSHGDLVEEVNHFGRHRTKLDDVLEVEDLGQEMVTRVKVLEIRLVYRTQLTPEELEELGYGSDQALSERIGAGERRLWYMRVVLVGANPGTAIQ